MKELIALGMAAVVALGVGAGQARADAAQNKEIVISAITGVFIKQDPAVVEKYWSESYKQHNPLFPNGREVIEGFVKNPPPGFSYEMGAVVAEGDLVMVRGRYKGFGPKPMIGVDMFRLENGKIVEHWDVLQEEVPADQSKNGNPMFEVGQ
jgi:predicted SnoaL-like aldol condensation-catalyzing enzyme